MLRVRWGAQASDAATSEQKLTVFVVTENAPLARALEAAVFLADWEAVTFCRPQDFLAVEHERIPSCLVLDIDLSEGLAVQDRIARGPIELPIIFVGSCGDAPLRSAP